MSTPNSLINVLPMDCWYMILEYLQPTDLNSLSRVSKVMYQNTIPHLYRNLVWNWNKNPLPRLLKLLSTIHDRPERLDLIERVEFTVPLEDRRLMSGLTRANRDLVISEKYRNVYRFCLRVLIRSNMPDLPVWIRHMDKGSPYVFATLLISQLPNLRHLSLDCSFVVCNGLPGMMFNHAMLTTPAATLSKFEHLKSIEYGLTSARIRPNNDVVYSPTYAPNVRGQHNPYQFTGFFFLPSLKVLQLWISTPLLTRLICAAAQRRAHTMENLDSLHLEGGYVKAADVNFLLLNMNNLKQLNLELSYLFPHEGWFSVQDMQEGLQSVAPTLERLSFRPSHLSCFGLFEWPQPIDPHNRRLRPSVMKFTTGFFTQFPNLVHLDVPAVYLTGGGIDRETLRENLPDSLETLQLRDQPIDMYWPGREFDELFCLLKDFFPDSATSHPYLHRINLDFDPKPDFWEKLQVPRFELWEFGQEVGTSIYVREPEDKLLPLFDEDEPAPSNNGATLLDFGSFCYSQLPPELET
ncbi:hypothetical protein N7493_000824 [Penicillium malachiteum]|uniref:F-box domain-containing protein n=1 Tax=Penicillium malachiteum TaxID=1324776 RepID=A0AAD6N1C6_9EURO|nr:hypothetical protein N7493_000824 [Penicillium malachiteum]